MTDTMTDVLEFVRENDVRFIKLGFCDLFGVQKNISIMPGELESAFKSGISFDASAVAGFGDITKSDLLLFPDPATITVLPWRPGPGRVVRFFCDIKNPDKTDFVHNGRYVLRRAVERCEKLGYTCKIGTECEFYLFRTGDDGEPTETPLDTGGYFDISPLDKGEDIRREVCLCLERMGLRPEASHHEQGPGQNEIDFEYSDALSAADNLLTFKSVVKSVAERNGLYASFMPKPIANHSGSGLHVNISLSKDGKNIFSENSGEHKKISESFIAGILSKAAEITLFLNPIPNSYERLGEFKAPHLVSWSHQNRSQLIRIPAAAGEKVRMELRSPDPALNPYLAFALILNAGIYGIEQAACLPPATDVDLYTASDDVIKGLERLPADLSESAAFAEKSSFVKDVIGLHLTEIYITAKKGEAADYNNSDDKEAFCKKRYKALI